MASIYFTADLNMKNLRTTLLTFSGILLLLLCTSGYAGNKIKAIDGCALNLENDDVKETTIVNLRTIKVIRYSKDASGHTTVTLIYGVGSVKIGRVSKGKLNLLINAYTYC